MYISYIYIYLIYIHIIRDRVNTWYMVYGIMGVLGHVGLTTVGEDFTSECFSSS